MRLSPKTVRRFRRTILGHYRKRGRALPWRRTKNPYRILVSEIMLQQTQVDRVIPKYVDFIKKFPSFAAIARAPLRKVLIAWQGLGYNRRARALHRTARIVVGKKGLSSEASAKEGGKLPSSIEGLESLPGVGPYTARAVRVFALNKPETLIETNVRSVFLDEFFPKQRRVPDAKLAPLIEATLDRTDPRTWYWALMDYGAMLKKTMPNPNRRSAHYVRQSPFRGSVRQARGALIKAIVGQKAVPARKLLALFPATRRAQARRCLAALECDGLIKESAHGYAAR